MAAHLPDDFQATERGNTLLVDEEGGYAAWVKLGKDYWLEVAYCPDNYPAFYIDLLKLTEEKLAASVGKRYEGWKVKKCNMQGLEEQAGYVRAPRGRKAKEK